MGTYSRRSAGSGAAAAVVTGNGFVANVRGQLIGRPLYGSALLDIESGDGVGGHPFFLPVPHLGIKRDVDMTVLGSAVDATTSDNYAIRMRPYLYRIGKICVGMPNGVPDNVNLSIWTGYKQSGDKLVDITPSNLAPVIADPYAIVEFALPNVHRSADHLFIHINTINATPLKLSFWAFGDVLISDDQRSQPI
jgi:hypothetical protein